MERSIDTVNSYVVRHKGGNYCRVFSDGGLSDPLRDDEVIMYSNLSGKDARILSEKYNRVHAAVCKRVYRDYLGLLNCLRIMYPNPPDYEEGDGLISVTVFYAYYGIGAFVQTNAPDDIWEERFITLHEDEVYRFIECIRSLDKNSKRAIMNECIHETDKLYHKMFDNENQRIPLDSLAQ